MIIAYDKNDGTVLWRSRDESIEPKTYKEDNEVKLTKTSLTEEAFVQIKTSKSLNDDQQLNIIFDETSNTITGKVNQK